MSEKDPDGDVRIGELFERFYLGSISDSEAAELSDRLANSKTDRDRFRRAGRIDAYLRGMSEGDDQGATSAKNRLPPEQTDVKLSWRILAVAAAIMIAVGITAWRWAPDQDVAARPSPNTPNPASPAHVASVSLSNLSGTVYVVDVDGVPRKAEEGETVGSRETVRTEGDEASARLTYADSTYVTFVRNSSATIEFDDAKRIDVQAGMLVAHVAKQSRTEPMVLTTTHARVDVLGTSFVLSANDRETDLAVAEGEVRVTRIRDSQSVVLSDGSRVVSSESSDLEVKPTVPTPRTWQQDFSSGVPEGWKGSPVDDGLPIGSSGGAKAVENPAFGNFVVESKQEWYDGLFEVQEGTHLHYTFKMDRPGWLNLFFLNRSDDFEQNGLMLCNTAPFDRVDPNTWYTMTVPISAWKRKNFELVEFMDDPLVPGEIIYSLALSNVGEDRGLVVDRIWVTTDGPGEIVLTKKKNLSNSF